MIDLIKQEELRLIKIFNFKDSVPELRISLYEHEIQFEHWRFDNPENINLCSIEKETIDFYEPLNIYMILSCRNYLYSVIEYNKTYLQIKYDQIEKDMINDHNSF